MGREDYIDQLYAAVSCAVPITRDAYAASLAGWEIEPVLMDGKQIGLCLINAGEIHMSLDKRGALLHARRIIRQHVATALQRFGRLTTRTNDDPGVLRFLRRLGFVPAGHDGKLAIMQLDKLSII